MAMVESCDWRKTGGGGAGEAGEGERGGGAGEGERGGGGSVG